MPGVFDDLVRPALTVSDDVPGERCSADESPENPELVGFFRSVFLGLLPLAENLIPLFVGARDVGSDIGMVEGSTKPIARAVTHAGICKVKRYPFDLP
jgi:hypothetical protein